MANFVTYDLAPSYLSTWIKVHHLPLVSGIEKKVLYSEVFILACVSEDTRADFFLFFFPHHFCSHPGDAGLKQKTSVRAAALLLPNSLALGTAMHH